MNPFQWVYNAQEYTTARTQQWETHINSNMNTADDMEELENTFNSKCGLMKNEITEQANTIVNVVHSYAPQSWDPNYWQKRHYYESLCQYASTAISFMDSVFENTFGRLKRLFTRLSNWIRNKVTQVYTAVKGFFRSAASRVKSWFS